MADIPQDASALTAPTTAMVLAAGLSTRMRPLSSSIPKPLVRLAGRPLIDHVLDRLAVSGVERAVVNVHYHADQIDEHLMQRKNAQSRPAILVSDERDALLDTGGGVKRALPKLGPDPFFVHNADSVWSEGAGQAIERMRSAWDGTRMDVLMLLAPTATSLGYAGRGDFVMAPDGALARRGEGEIAPFVFAGVSIMHPRLFADAPEGKFSLNLIWDRVLEEGRLFGLRHDGVWMHVGTPTALAEAERWFEGGGT